MKIEDSIYVNLIMQANTSSKDKDIKTIKKVRSGENCTISKWRRLIGSYKTITI